MKESLMKAIEIPIGRMALAGNLVIPAGAGSIVIFSHGSGSSRFSPRNNYVASVLNQAKMATLMIDLLTAEEDLIYENRFNIDLLTERLMAATTYILHKPELKGFTVGYFGASTGAASALKASGRLNRQINAVVSRGGRPDLAEAELGFVMCPVLLIVGSNDHEVIKLNEKAYDRLGCEKKIEIINGASHLFEEEGKLAEVAILAKDWFKKFLIKDKIHAKENKNSPV